MGNSIRPVQLSDAQAVCDIYTPLVSDSATSFEVVPPAAATMRSRIQALKEQYPWLVFEGQGVVLGYAYASPHRERYAYRWSVDVSVYIKAQARGAGVGRALYTALLDLLRRQGYANAYAGITLPNPASVGLHEAMGFTRVGTYIRVGFKFGSWHDVVWYHLRLQEAPIPTDQLLSAEALFRDQGAEDVLRESVLIVRLR